MDGTLAKKMTKTTMEAPLCLEPPESSERAVIAQPSRQGFFCLWHGTTLGNWLRLVASRPPMHWTRLPKLASITALATLNSISSALESLVFGRRIARQKIEHPPIFILGHWRSGTTLLHNLMSLDPKLTYPNLYQVMNAGSFLLTEKVVTRLTGWLLPKTRPMDNIPAGWEMPQEDEIALLLTTLISPYLMVAHQGNRSVWEPSLELTQLPPEVLQRWKTAFLHFLKKLTIRANRPIVLKSPTHTYRIPMLLKMFPDAKFVYIYRDPYAVYSSFMHLRRSLFRENGLGRLVNDGNEAEALQIYTECIDRYEQTKNLIPPNHLHEIRFEELEADPLGQMKLLYQRLGLTSWNDVEPAIVAELPVLANYQKNPYVMDRTLMRRIYERWKPYFGLYGYPSQLPDEESDAVSNRKDFRCDVSVTPAG